MPLEHGCTLVIDRDGGWGDCGKPAIAKYTLKADDGQPFHLYRCGRHEQGMLVQPPARIVAREALA